MKTKKLFAIVSVVVALTVILSISASAAFQEPKGGLAGVGFQMYRCTGNGVNWREGPGSSYWSNGLLYSGDRCFASSYNGALYKTENGFAVTNNGGGSTGGLSFDSLGIFLFGWVSTSYLAFIN